MVGAISESRRSGIGIPSYRAVGIGKSLRIATVGNRNSLLPRCRDRKISPNRDGRESEFPPTALSGSEDLSESRRSGIGIPSYRAVGIGRSLRIATVGNRNSLLPALSGSGNLSESRRSGIGIPSYRAVGIGKSLRIATVGNRNSLLPRCWNREISPNRDGRESEFPPTALSGSGNLSESRRSGIGVPSYRAVGIGRSLRIATVGNRNSLLPRCRDREIPPNRDGRESGFPPTSAVGIGKSLRIATVGNRDSLLPALSESGNLSESRRSGIGIPAYRAVGIGRFLLPQIYFKISILRVARNVSACKE